MFFEFFKKSLSDFISLIYPDLCLGCGKLLVEGENLICFDCIVRMPRTNFHKIENNKVEMIFWGRVKIERASSFFIYQKGSIWQKVLHKIKYKGFKDAGYELGKNYGYELKDSDYFKDIDYIVPVPLHPKKERKRGYNQSLYIAEGLSSSLDKPVEKNNLYRSKYTNTQTKKGRYERWENVNSIFSIKSKEIYENKHILIVDDVITTGSTLEACANAILQCKGSKVSIVTLAFASG